MIRLTLNPQSEPEIHLFSKSTILIGGENSPVDLVLPGLHIQPLHLKIIEQDQFLILINVTNDPFVSVNGHPFGRKLLNAGDTITIHQTEILFETLQEAEKMPEESQALSDLTPETIAPIVDPSLFALSFEHEVELLKDEEWQKISLDHYCTETAAPSIQEEVKQPEPLPAVKQKPLSLKDDYLRELEDDHQQDKDGPFGHLAEPSHLIQAWKWILLFIFSVLAIAGVIGTVIYFSVSDKTEAQETKAAQGVADLAMALTHAQLLHLKPHNQNWTDIEFLKSNLQALLPHISSYASQIDAQGQFNCCPYSLRIYTTGDMSHFLLIAQPAPSVLHWLIPKASIIVDSHLMELRTLKDLRSLNRLLANQDPLDHMNGKEITQLIKQGELIHLSHLAIESNHPDFAPPKNLAWMKPGSENYIYNVPRYYRLGEVLMQKAKTLATSKGTSQEVTQLKQEVETFSMLHPFILYTDQGKKSAISMRQALVTYVPTNKLLYGYLTFDSQGKLEQADLLKEDEELEGLLISHATIEEESTDIALENVEEEKPSIHVVTPSVDVNHPIYIKLHALIVAREQELKPLISHLQSLLAQELMTPHLKFSFEFSELSGSFLAVDLKYKQLLQETLLALHHQYEELPINDFLNFAKYLHLDQLIQKNDQSFQVVDENCLQNIETLICHIEKSHSLVELDNLVNICLSWLTLDYIKDPQHLINYQNMLRNQTLEQLKKYLISQKDTQTGKIQPTDRDILQHLLSAERLVKPEEKEFFLEEFDALIATKLEAETKAEEKAASEQIP